MFTGIVEEAGTVVVLERLEDRIRLVVEARVCGEAVELGDSIAVNGCCLTVVGLTGPVGARRVGFDLLEETWNRTSLRLLKPGMVVNLERALAVGDRIGGHFVTGHVDATGCILRWEASGNDHLLEIQLTAETLRYVVFKGSISVDGMSLTVAGVTAETVRIWIIPHTLEVTSLRERKVGDWVNIEVDMLGKYVERFTASWASRGEGGDDSAGKARS